MVRPACLSLLLTPVCIALVASLLSEPARADCPAICAQLNSSTPVCSTESSFEFDFYNPRAACAWDLGRGILDVSSSSPANLSCDLTVEDDWEATGPASGTPIDLTARLATTLGATPEEHEVGLIATLQEGASNVDSLSVWAPNGWTDTLSVAVHVEAGVPFRMIHHLRLLTSGSYNQNWVTGQILFVGIPEGVEIKSCQGVALVATRPSTWGALKARYR